MPITMLKISDITLIVIKQTIDFSLLCGSTSIIGDMRVILLVTRSVTYNLMRVDDAMTFLVDKYECL
jgi:hypothetical protein